MVKSKKVSKEEKSLLERFLGSQTRAQLLSIFLLNPDEYLDIPLLVRMTGKDRKGVSEEVKFLLYEVNLLSHEVVSKLGGPPRFRLARNHPWLPALKLLFENALGSIHAIREEFLKLISIDVAFVYGSFARNEQRADSDVDIIIIGHQTMLSLSSQIGKIEKRIGRQIDFKIYTPDQWHEKYKSHDHFVTALMQGPKIFLVGDNERLGRISG